MIYFAMLAKQFVDCEEITHPIDTIMMVGTATTQVHLTAIKAQIEGTAKLVAHTFEDDEMDADELEEEAQRKLIVVDKAFHDSFLAITETMGTHEGIAPDHVAMMAAMTKA